MSEAVLDVFEPLGSDQTEGLAELIAEDPLDTQPYLVLGDLLQARSDPRGELIAIQHARLGAPGDPALVERELALLREQSESLLGSTLHAHKESLDLRWYCGFVEYARIDPPTFDGLSTGALVRALFDEMTGAFVRDLAVGRMLPEPGTSMPYYEDVIRVLGEVKPAALRSLILGSVPDVYEPPVPVAADLRELDASATERLERLVIHGGLVHLGTLDLPHLKELAIITTELSYQTLADLAASELPALERLNLWMGQTHIGTGTQYWKELEVILGGERFPRLRHLALQQLNNADAIVGLILRTPLVKQLRTLGLAMGTMSRDGAQQILEHADAVSHLGLLNLQDNYIPPSYQDRLRGVCRVVRLGIQQEHRGARLINLMR